VAWQPEAARPDELDAALDLLRRLKLPVHGVAEGFRHYLAVHDTGLLVGLCGLESYGHSALLRSVAVEPNFQGQGVGAALIHAVVNLATRIGVEELYLLTTGAPDYFARHGFLPCERANAPEGVRESWEFRSGCPSGATLMVRRVGAQAGEEV